MNSVLVSQGDTPQTIIMKRSLRRTASLSFISLLLLLRCGPLDPGSSSQAGNPKIMGTLYEQDGKRAADARILAVPAGYDPLSGAPRGPDSTTSDDTGGYRFDYLPADTYNILGSGRTGLSKTSVSVTEGTAAVVPDDTLLLPGSVRGVVRLLPGDDINSVYIIPLGTTMLGAPENAAGDFALRNMARGSYRVRLFSTLGSYQSMDTVFRIQAGKETVIRDTLRLKYTGIPVPAGVKILYDTMKQIVTVMWNKPTTGRTVKGYNVYRKRSDSTVFAGIKSGVADTVYRDSTGAQDRTYEYRIAAEDTNGTEGMKSGGAGVTIEGACKLVATFGKGTGGNEGFFNVLCAVAVDESGNIFCADEGNNRIQKFDSAGNFVLQWGTYGTGDGRLNQPVDIAIDSTGAVYVVEMGNHRIQKFDGRGGFIAKWGSEGTGTGQFEKPRMVCINRGFVYVGEWNGKRVQKFDLDGDLISSISFVGNVSGLAANDSMVLVTSDERCVLRYSVDGAFVDTVLKGGKCVNSAEDRKMGGAFFLPDQASFIVTNLSEDTFWGVTARGEVFVKQYVYGEGGSIVDLWAKGEFIFVACFNGYIRKYDRW